MWLLLKVLALLTLSTVCWGQDSTFWEGPSDTLIVTGDFFDTLKMYVDENGVMVMETTGGADTCFWSDTTRAPLDAEYWIKLTPFAHCYNRIPDRWEVRVDTSCGCPEGWVARTVFTLPGKKTVCYVEAWAYADSATMVNWPDSVLYRMPYCLPDPCKPLSYEPLIVPYLTEEQIKKLMEILED